MDIRASRASRAAVSSPTLSELGLAVVLDEGCGRGLVEPAGRPNRSLQPGKRDGLEEPWTSGDGECAGRCRELQPDACSDQECFLANFLNRLEIFVLV